MRTASSALRESKSDYAKIYYNKAPDQIELGAVSPK